METNWTLQERSDELGASKGSASGRLEGGVSPDVRHAVCCLMTQRLSAHDPGRT